MRMGVIGLNHPHAEGHMQALEGAPEIEQLLIWDPDPQRVQQAAKKWAKAEPIVSPDDLLADPYIPAMAIFVPDVEAGAWNLRAVQAGKWVYGDKPGAQTAAELAKIVEAAQQTGVHFCPCYANRVHPVALEIRQLLQKGAIGEILSFHCMWITSSVLVRGPESWLFHKAYSAGGILTWLGCHWLDMLRFLLACEVVEVAAMTATFTPEVDVEEVATVCLRLANGAVGMLRAGYLLPIWAENDDSDLQFQFEGTQGALTWHPHSQPPGYRLRTVNPEFARGSWGRRVLIDPAPSSSRPGYAGEFLAHFLRAVRGEGEAPATEEDAWQVMRIVEAAYASAQDGRSIRLDA